LLLNLVTSSTFQLLSNVTEKGVVLTFKGELLMVQLQSNAWFEEENTYLS